jgi:uncharacterized protein
MRTVLLNAQGEKTYAAIFDKGDEFMSGLLGFAKRESLSGSHFTAIGGFSRATLGYFDPERKEYRKIPVEEQVEVLSLVGDIALADDGPQVHAHVVVGRSDGTTRGGHILEAHVWPTLEVIVSETPKHLQRRPDPEVGLALIRV